MKMLRAVPYISMIFDLRHRAQHIATQAVCPEKSKRKCEQRNKSQFQKNYASFHLNRYFADVSYDSWFDTGLESIKFVSSRTGRY